MQANKNESKLQFQHIKLKRSHTDIDNKPEQNTINLVDLSEHEQLVLKLQYILNNDKELANYVAD